MDVSTTTFQPIFEGVKQYIVPLFQRSYSWTKKEWSALWSDLYCLYEGNKPRQHFMGSIVTIPTQSVPEGVSKFLLIDGQQRITTLYLLLLIIWRVYEERGEEERAEEVRNTFLVNPYKRGSDFYKLLPTHIDRSSFKSLINPSGGEFDGLLIEACNFFKRKISNNIDLEKLKNIITGKLSVVSIVLDANDNPYLVFESLNYKGMPLSVTDLIRNYVFMKVHIDEQEDIYKKVWEPMQEALGDSLPEFVRHYLMKDGEFIKKSDVYALLKDQIDDIGVKNCIYALKSYSAYYAKLLNPELEQNKTISVALRIIKRLEISTAYPFLLNCYNDFGTGNISAEKFADVLFIIENFIIRRFVCGVPSNQLNKIFPLLYTQMKKLDGEYLTKLRRILQTKNYPKNYDFLSNLKTNRLYGAGDRIRKTKLLLERIEESCCHKERGSFEELTIEHIMPQTLTSDWEIHLGEGYSQTHELLLNTLGNLTLTGYNGEMSNSSFTIKKEILNSSHLELNKYFRIIERWDENAITERSQKLADCLIEIYPYFGVEAENTSLDNVTGTKPRTLNVLGQNIDVSSWAEVLGKTLEIVAEIEPEKLDTLALEYSSFVGKDNRRFRRSKSLPNGYYYEANLSATYIYQFCKQVASVIELDEDEWTVELHTA